MPPDFDPDQPSSLDAIITRYKRFLDRPALRESLKLTPTERFQKHQAKLAELTSKGKAGKKREVNVAPPASPQPVIPLDRDPVVELYKKDVDRTMLRESLKRSVTERFEANMALQRFAEEMRRGGRQTFTP
jgi:hypothetical protein